MTAIESRRLFTVGVFGGLRYPTSRARQWTNLQEAGSLGTNSGEPLDVDVVDRTLRRVRAERDRRNLGKLQ